MFFLRKLWYQATFNSRKPATQKKVALEDVGFAEKLLRNTKINAKHSNDDLAEIIVKHQGNKKFILGINDTLAAGLLSLSSIASEKTAATTLFSKINLVNMCYGNVFVDRILEHSEKDPLFFDAHKEYLIKKTLSKKTNAWDALQTQAKSKSWVAYFLLSQDVLLKKADAALITDLYKLHVNDQDFSEKFNTKFENIKNNIFKNAENLSETNPGYMILASRDCAATLLKNDTAFRQLSVNDIFHTLVTYQNDVQITNLVQSQLAIRKDVRNIQELATAVYNTEKNKDYATIEKLANNATLFNTLTPQQRVSSYGFLVNHIGEKDKRDQAQIERLANAACNLAHNDENMATAFLNNSKFVKFTDKELLTDLLVANCNAKTTQKFIENLAQHELSFTQLAKENQFIATKLFTADKSIYQSIPINDRLDIAVDYGKDFIKQNIQALLPAFETTVVEMQGEQEVAAREVGEAIDAETARLIVNQLDDSDIVEFLQAHAKDREFSKRLNKLLSYANRSLYKIALNNENYTGTLLSLAAKHDYIAKAMEGSKITIAEKRGKDFIDDHLDNLLAFATQDIDEATALFSSTDIEISLYEKLLGPNGDDLKLCDKVAAILTAHQNTEALTEIEGCQRVFTGIRDYLLDKVTKNSEVQKTIFENPNYNIFLSEADKSQIAQQSMKASLKKEPIYRDEAQQLAADAKREEAINTRLESAKSKYLDAVTLLNDQVLSEKVSSVDKAEIIASHSGEAFFLRDLANGAIGVGKTQAERKKILFELAFEDKHAAAALFGRPELVELFTEAEFKMIQEKYTQNADMETDFETLGLQSDATAAQVKRKFIILSKQTHSDKTGDQADNAEFSKIEEVYKRLIKEIKATETIRNAQWTKPEEVAKAAPGQQQSKEKSKNNDENKKQGKKLEPTKKSSIFGRFFQGSKKSGQNKNQNQRQNPGKNAK